jgi:uncharacterized membrane protein
VADRPAASRRPTGRAVTVPGTMQRASDKKRALVGAAVAVLLVAWAAPAAFASDNGEGLLGETTDKLVTFFALGVLGFFVLVVVLASIAQALLEQRKERQKALHLRRRIGW